MKKISALISVFLILLTPVNAAASQTAQVAGSFYPADARRLKSFIETYLEGPRLSNKAPKILIVPHAGIQYSGSVAGKGFQQLKDSGVSVAIILGVAHQYPSKIEGAFIDPSGTFETPLGQLEVEQETSLRLMALTPKIKAGPDAFLGEHSVEVELPFLQILNPDLKIVPLVMNVPDLKNAEEVGNAIAQVMRENETAGKKTVLIVSSDFAHYPEQKDADFSDLTMLKYIEALDPAALFEASKAMMQRGFKNLVTTMCGEAGVLTGLYAAKALGMVDAQILKHTTSADIPDGDTDRVVGYGAVAIYESPTHEVKDLPLTEDDKKSLLQLARDSVRAALEKQTVLWKSASPVMKLPRAVFVTLRKNGELRGCIGGTQPVYPLSDAVAYFAKAAAFEDPRFAPVRLEELKEITFEISLLSSWTLAPTIDAIQPGRDGVILRKGESTGLFLPQVWKETRWDKETFLNELASEKAGLPKDAWKDPRTELFTFSVDTFEDKTF